MCPKQYHSSTAVLEYALCLIRCKNPDVMLHAGVLMPVPGNSSGTYSLTVDEGGKKASWTLELCDAPSYLASHLHTVSTNHY